MTGTDSASGYPVPDEIVALATKRRVRVGVLSDTHIPECRRELWPQVFDAFRDVDCILHGGDLHELHVLERLHEVAPTLSARGNGEDGSGGRPQQPEHPRLQESWDLTLGGARVGITHDLPIPERSHYPLDRAIERYFGGGRFDALVYGHSHVEALDVIDGTVCLNPGSPTYPHNLEVQLGTIAFIDIDDGKVSASVWQLVDEGIEPFDWSRWRR